MELRLLLESIWIVLPAYIANGSPVIGNKILESIGVDKHPIDRGKNFIDDKRLFGDNKTWEGFIIGVLAGILTGIIQMVIDNSYLYIARGLIMGIGAMVGDLLGSFIKRRFNIKPGDPLPILDQTLFLIVAIALARSAKVLYMTPIQILFVIIITPVLHILTNYIAYRLGFKKVPW